MIRTWQTLLYGNQVNSEILLKGYESHESAHKIYIYKIYIHALHMHHILITHFVVNSSYALQIVKHRSHIQSPPNPVQIKNGKRRKSSIRVALPDRVGICEK